MSVERGDAQVEAMRRVPLLFRIGLAMALLLGVCGGTARAQTPDPERAALEALYDATGGDDWVNNTNWKSALPVDDWHGVTVSGGKVTKLVLDDNELSGSIPPALGNLTSLTGLYLDDNELSGSIPTALGNLTSLQQLVLGANGLTGTIPEGLRHLSNLELLDVSGTEVCAPSDSAFQTWLASITYYPSTAAACSPPVTSPGPPVTSPDPQPSAPRNLTAVGGEGEVVLNWSAPEDDGGSRITNYEYRIDGRGRWISIGSTNTTHTVTGLVNGTTYVFQVRAVDRSGKRSKASNRAEVTLKVFTLDFAHFANGDGLTSDLVFVNVGTQPIRPALYFYDKEGNLIAAESVVDITDDLEIQEDSSLSIQTAMEPLEELTISTHGQGEVVSGSVKVVSDGPIGGVLRFNLPDIGVAGVGASSPVSDALFPVRRQEAGINTGVAIHNLESSPEIVRC